MKFLQFRLRFFLLMMIPIALFIALATAAMRARTSANASACINNPRYMAIHLLNYRDTYGHYPQAIFTGQGAKPLHSWRTLLYNYMEAFSPGSDFRRNYNLAQPWNSSANLATARLTPRMFVCENNQGEPPRYTNYGAVIDRGVSSLERADAIPDGNAEATRQILVVEYPNSNIPWTEPRDLDIADLSRLTEGADPGIVVGFADGRLQRMSLAELRTLLAQLQGTPLGKAGIGPPAEETATAGKAPEQP